MEPLDELPLIRLDQLLKHEGVVATGGQAKRLIQEGEVQVNGQVEWRRRRKLSAGDRVRVGDVELIVCSENAT